MAQAQVIAKVSSLSGEAYARDSAGKLRRLKAGDAIREGETVVAGDGAQVVLRLADGREMTVLPGETARLDAEVAALVKPDASDSAVVNNPDEFEKIAKALATGGDLDALLEDPAAGVAGPGSEGGHSFVEFLRVVESVDSLSYQFATTRIATPEIIENPASPVSELGDANGPTANAGAGTPPTGSDAGYTLNEDTARTFAAGDFGFADADAGQTLLAMRIDSLPVAGSLSFNGVPVTGGQIIAVAELAQLVYTPGANASGAPYAGFDFSVQDSSGAFATTPNRITLTVAAVDDASLLAPDSQTVAEDTVATGNVLANDSDIDSVLTVAGFTVAGVAGSFNAGQTATIAGAGTLCIAANGDYSFTPLADWNGTLPTATYTTNTGSTSTLDLSVTPINDAPTPADPGTPAFDPATGNYSVTTLEDTPVSGQVVGTDADGDPLTYAKGSDPANGTVTVNADGTWTYTPGANYNGSDSFTVRIGDGHGGSATSTVFVGVTPVNDAPTPADPGNPAFDPATGNYSVTTLEDTPVSGQVVGTDADGDPLTYAKGSDPANGTVTVNADGTWTYVPGQNYNGSDSFTVRIADGHGGTATSTVFVGVMPVDDASLLAPDSHTVVEDTVAVGNVLTNDGDVDNALSIAGFTVAGVVGSFSAGQTATIAGIGTLTIAASGDYSFTPLANWNGTVPTASYTTNSGSTSTLDLTVTPLDDTPSISDDIASTPEDTPVLIHVLDNDSDADGDALTIIAIAGQPVVAGDTVAVAHGTATLNADGSITFTPAGNYHGPATFTYTASDGRTPVSGDVNVTVTAVNDAPLAVNDSATTAEDTPVTILVRANDSDADGDPLTVTAFTNPANGTLTQNAQGNLVYTPNANFNGADSFTYTISDGQGGFDTATVTVNVGGSNDAPVANPDAGNTGEDATLVVSAANGVIQNDSDLDSDSLSVSGVAFGASTGTVGSPLAGAWGSLTLHADGSYTYVPNAAAQVLDDGESRTDVFTYTVSDPGGLSSTTTLSLTVSGANDGPLAIDDARTTPEDTPVTIAVLGNDSDIDGEALLVSAIAGQPVTAGDSVAVANGTATLNADGTIIFTPAAGYNGPADFSYTITDGTASDTANVHLVIDDVNDPPLALDNVVNGSEDSPVNFDPRSNDSDPDGDPLSITAIDGQPLGLATPVTLSQSVVSLNADGTLTFTPNPNVNGPVSFQYTITDGRGGSDTALVNLNIVAVDDPSVLVADAGTTPEDIALSGNVLANDGDIDNSLAVASFTVNGVAGSFTAGQTATVAGIGAITLGANGDYSFTPATNWHGTVPTVNYTTNTDSASTLDINVTPVDDAFSDGDEIVSVAEDTMLTGSVLTGTSSVDGPVTVSGFTVAGVAGSFNAGQTASIAGVGTLTIAADGSYTFTPVANYFAPVPVATYTLSDGSSGDTSTLTITVTPVDDAFADADEIVSIAEDTTLTGSVLSGTSSVDGPVSVTDFTVAGVTGSFTAGQTATITGVGTLSIAANGGYTFTPAANYTGAVPVVNYTLSDGSSGDTSTLSITVSPGDDAFSDVDEVVNIAEDTTLTGNVLTGTTSVDGVVTVTGFTVAGLTDSFTAGQTATIVGVGTLQINANGGYTFTPATNYNGAVPVATYTLSDGSGGNTSTLSITVTPVDDAFSDANEVVSVAEDTILTGTVLSGTTSVDGPVTVTGFTVVGVAGSFAAGQMATIAGVGTLSIAADGSYTFTPVANYVGVVPVATYTLSDGSSGDASTLSITVTPVDDVFADADEIVSVAEDTTLTGTVLSGTSSVDGSVTVTSFMVAGVAGNFTASQTANIAGIGALQINADGSYIFTPTTNYAGPVPAATYALSDGSSGDTSMLSITVNPVDDAFSDADETLSVAEDTTLTGSVLTGTTSVDGPVMVSGFTVAGVAGDFAAGQTANIAGVGTLTIAADGSYTFTPVANYTGPVPVATYTLSDGSSGDTSTLAITVTPVDDAFADANEIISVAEDTMLTGSVLAGTSSVDGPVTVSGFTVAGVTGSFTAGQTATIVGIGTLTIAADGGYSFIPAANYAGSVPVATYTLTDGSSGDASTLSITVTPVDDAFSDADETVGVAEDTTLIGSVLTGTTSVDGPVTVTGFTVAGIAGNFTAGQTASIVGVGTLSIAADGSYSFTPAANYVGAVPVAIYTLSDGSSGDTSTLSITVTPVDDAFSDVDETVRIAEETALTGTVLSGTSSVDGSVSVTGFTVAGVAGSFNAGQTATIGGVGALQINADGGYTFTPTANYNGTVPVATYTLSDGSSGDTSMLAITVTPVDDAFTDANEVPSVAEDTILTGSVLSGTSSVDGPVTVSGFTVAGVAGSLAAGQTANIAGVGTLSIAANGDYTFTPVANYNGVVPVATYTLTDGSSGDTSTLSITVTPANDGPVAQDDSQSVRINSAANGNVLSNDSDPEGDTLTVTGFTIDGTTYAAGATASLSGVGTLVINSNGSYTFTPAPLYSGAIPVATYTVSDGTASASATLILTMDPNGGTATVSLSGPDTVMEGGNATYTLTLDRAPVSDVTVMVTLTHLDTVSRDIVSVPVTVTIPAGVKSATFDLGTFDDALDELAENYRITITNPSGGGFDNLLVGNASQTTTIVDNDLPPSVASVVSDDDFVDENRDASPLNNIVQTGTIQQVGSGDAITIGGDATGVTANGQPVTYAWNAATKSLTASSSEGTVFTLKVNADNSTYTFTQVRALDHLPNVQGEGESETLAFTLSVDGGISSANFTVTVFDDAPTVTGPLIIGTANQPGQNVTGTLPLELSNDVTDLTWNPASSTLPTLYADGRLVQYEWNNTGDVLTGYIMNGSVREDVFKLDIELASKSYVFNTYTELLGGAITTSSFDGTTGGNSGSLQIIDSNHNIILIDATGVRDGVAAQVNYSAEGISVNGGAGNWIDAVGGEILTLSYTRDVTSATFGLEPQGQSAVMNWAAYHDGVLVASGSNIVVGKANPEQSLTITASEAFDTVLFTAASGQYRPEIQSISYIDYNANISLNLAYQLQDSDLDRASGSITINLSGTPAPMISASTALVSEEGLSGTPLAPANPDDTGWPSDNTNATTFSGTMGISGSGSLSVALHPPVTELTSGGATLNWSGVGTGTLTGSANGADILRVTMQNDGSYSVTLLGPVDHPVSGAEDALSFNLGVTVSNGTTSRSAVLTISVEDDAPVASSSLVSVGGTATHTNLAIVLDLSGSMNDPSGLTSATRLAVTKEAIKELIDTYDGMGDVMVNVTVFGSSGTNGSWMTAASALQFINAVEAFSTSSTMYTNYDAALASAMSAYGGAGKLTGSDVQNVLYFLSDGAPNRSDGNSSQLLNATPTNSASDNGIQGTEETLWTNFLTSNRISAYAIGLGTGVTTANMDPVAYDGVTGTPRDSVAVGDLNDLGSVLASTIESRVTGAIMAGTGGSGGFGADGGTLVALTYGNNTFSFDGNTLTVGGAGTTAYSFDAATHVLTVTAVGGPFVVDMDSGEYTYTRTPSSTVAQEVFGYTLNDRDGDTASGTLTIDLPDYDTAPVGRDDRVTVASGNVSWGSVVIKDAWLTWNDSDAESATLSVSAVSGATSHSGDFIYTVTDGGQFNDAAVTITTRDSSTLNGTGLDNILIGDGSSEAIRGYEGNDVLVGNAGADTLEGGAGNDLLIGGSGNDSLTGGLGSDTFAWSLADQGTAATPARDTITDFSAAAKSAGGDMLDLRDLLQGENHATGTGNLGDFLHFSRSGSDTVIDIKPTGAGGATQQIVMSGVDLTVGNTLNDQAIIQDLLTKGKLLTD